MGRQPGGEGLMQIDRRDLLRAGVPLFGAAFLPGAVLAAKAARKTYGMIEISASGMTVSVYQLDRETLAGGEGMSGFERVAPKRAGDPWSVVESPLRPGVEEEAANETVALVQTQVDRLLALGVERPDIAIVVSSGVMSFSAKLVTLIRERLKEKTGLGMDVISPREEARLTFDWVVPERRRGSTFLLDIGSGNSKGGYFDQRGKRGRYFDISAPYGTKTMAGAVKFRFPDARTQNFAALSSDFYTETVAPALKPQIDAIPKGLHMPDVLLTGGIVWATSMILYPKAMAEQRNWVPLLPDDFARVGALITAGTPYGAGLPADLSPAQRDYVVKVLKGVRNVFNPHQLAAGAALADGLIKQLDWGGRKTLVFPTFASNAWGSQYLVETFVHGGMRYI
jgi:hypothetical protein